MGEIFSSSGVAHKSSWQANPHTLATFATRVQTDKLHMMSRHQMTLSTADDHSVCPRPSSAAAVSINRPVQPDAELVRIRVSDDPPRLQNPYRAAVPPCPPCCCVCRRDHGEEVEPEYNPEVVFQGFVRVKGGRVVCDKKWESCPTSST